MNKELKAKWVEALRSGKYGQGTGSLHPSDNVFCCLGVLCDVIDPSRWDGPRLGRVKFKLKGHDGRKLLPEELMKAEELSSDQIWQLAGMNDCEKPFSEIASYIEENL